MEVENSRKKIADYLRRNLSKGYTLESLKWALIGQGYSRTDVATAIGQINKEKFQNIPLEETKEKPKIKYYLYDEDNRLITEKKPCWKFW